VISGERRWSSSPFGPLTETRPGAISTVTASGTSIGFLPIRLIASSGSPDVGDDLAAHALLLRLMAGHHADPGADYRGAGAAVDARHVLVVDVPAAAGTGDPFQARDHRAAVLGVFEVDPDLLADPGGLLGEVADVALLLEDPGHLQLQPRRGDLHVV